MNDTGLHHGCSQLPNNKPKEITVHKFSATVDFSHHMTLTVKESPHRFQHNPLPPEISIAQKSLTTPNHIPTSDTGNVQNYGVHKHICFWKLATIDAKCILSVCRQQHNYALRATTMSVQFKREEQISSKKWKEIVICAHLLSFRLASWVWSVKEQSCVIQFYSSSKISWGM